MNPRANKFLSVTCPLCKSEAGEKCTRVCFFGFPFEIKPVDYFHKSRRIATDRAEARDEADAARIQEEEAKLEKTKP